MLGRTLAFVGGVCIFAAIAVPRADTDAEMMALEGVSGASRGTSGASSDSDWYAGDHALQRQPNGHFYASAHVDGVPVRMMVDTGASVIALTASDASAIGIYWDDAEISHIGQGASGPVYGVQTRLDEVEIGGIVRRNVAAVVIPQGLDVSLLGQSYLSQVGGVEISGDTMIFSGS